MRIINLMRLKYNFHTHTPRCGHAIGSEEEYVLGAIKAGIKSFGFSDHIFLPDLHEEGVRGDYEELDDYLNDINYLKEKYKDQIDIYVGFEAEYFEEYLDYYKELLDSHKIDYLLLGNHSFIKDGKIVDYFYPGCPKENLYEYARNTIEAMRSGLFKYLCHPDLFIDCYPEFDEDMKKCSIAIIKEAERLHMPLEVNLGGIIEDSWNEEHNYSCRGFFELTKNYNVDIVLGLDAHDLRYFEEKSINKAFDFIDKLGLNFQEDYHIWKRK